MLAPADFEQRHEIARSELIIVAANLGDDAGAAEPETARRAALDGNALGDDLSCLETVAVTLGGTLNLATGPNRASALARGARMWSCGRRRPPAVPTPPQARPVPASFPVRPRRDLRRVTSPGDADKKLKSCGRRLATLAGRWLACCWLGSVSRT
jgi:hypothetical protein